MKGAATVAAAGGIIATVANPAAGHTASRPNTGVIEQASATAPSAVGPVSAPVASSNALSAIGYAAKPASATKAKPQVIENLVVKEQRAQAAAKAKADAKARAAAAARTATQQASRSTTRSAPSASTSTPTTNSAVSIGTKSSHNWATAGQCTWGALNQWYQATGFYPGGWTGNALTWAYGAANAGWTVTSTPRVRSIVVMQPGTYTHSSAGHVAWVTAVNGNQVTILEMNALAGPYNYNTRTVTNVAGMKYILAP